MENFEWLVSLHQVPKYADWYEKDVLRRQDIPNYYMFKKSFEEPVKQVIINPSVIKGIIYDDFLYNVDKGYSWLDLIYNLKRFNRIKRNFLNTNALIAHIHKNEDNKIVEKYGDTYITSSGQHRLALAKFLNLTEVEVEVRKFKIQ